MGIAFGFRRLAIQDPSPAGNQPMTSASGRYVIVFNGEIYNYVELRTELEQSGATFRGRSDTEVALAAIERWGFTQALARFVGMFAIALWDRQARALTLARDRFGIKPLFIGVGDASISFGSELKALVAGPDFDRSIDVAAVASFLRHLYVPAPHTIYRGAFKLLPGHTLRIVDPAAGLPKMVPYWSARETSLAALETPLVTDADEALEKLHGLLRDAVRIRTRADVPWGVLLSGGLDSSLVTALVHDVTGRPAKTFTVDFDEAEHSEARHAAAVARHLESDHYEQTVTGDDALELVAKLPTMFDEPLANPAQIPTFLLSRFARQHVTVALAGDGGDELFAGYNRYRLAGGAWRRLVGLPSGMRRALAAGAGGIARAARGRRASALVERIGAFGGQRLIGEKLSKTAMIAKASDITAAYACLMAAWHDPADIIADDVTPYWDVEATMRSLDALPMLRRMMVTDQLSYLPDDLLAKVDRASMAVSLEVRVPLLDHRVAEFSARMDPSLLWNRGEGKQPLRRILDTYVPRKLMDRPKVGFTVPLDAWLRGPLREWGGDLMAGAGAAGLPLRGDELGVMWDGYQRGKGGASGLRFWAVLSLLNWAHHWKNA